MTLEQIEELLIQLQTQIAQNTAAINNVKNIYATVDDVTAINNQVKNLISNNDMILSDVAALSNMINNIDHLGKLRDVSIKNLSDGDVLQYDAASGKWYNVKITVSDETGGSTVTSLAGLSDVQLTSVSDGNSLVYNSSIGKWTNDTISISGGDNEINPNLYLTKTQAASLYLPKTGGDIDYLNINGNLLVKKAITMYGEQ